MTTIECYEFVIVTHEADVFSTFVPVTNLKKFDDTPLPQTVPTVPERSRNRIRKARAAMTLDKKFESFESFKTFFE